jgi:(E)-4-hydroxy-3-methylbut-2-enyl-diphosphate synthase
MIASTKESINQSLQFRETGGYAASLTEYKRLLTKEVKIGNLLLGNFNPIRVQTMTTTDTMDTIATVEQTIRCIEAGAELVRITAPSKKEAENLLNIKNELHKRGYSVPLVADIHFTPNAAEIAARIVEKVRVNPGNYVDKKKFEIIEYTDRDYADEIDRIQERFTPLVKICKEYGTAMRIGTNHGSLSDRIMSRYGDTPMGMVESAMEFLRIARSENYHNIMLSMKSSNPQVMVQAYRMLIKTMQDEFGEIYPLHLGVTEAGDGEDGRIKSAVGIGTLLEDGIGDTIRVSLTEDPELEIPVCRDLIKSLPCPPQAEGGTSSQSLLSEEVNSYAVSSKSGERSAGGPSHREGSGMGLPYNPFAYKRRETFSVGNIGGNHVPVVVADLSKLEKIAPQNLESIGYKYDEATDKWTISDAASDYVFTGHHVLSFALPGTLKTIVYPATWLQAEDKDKYFPIYDQRAYAEGEEPKSSSCNFVMIDCFPADIPYLSDMEYLNTIGNDPTVVFCLSSTNKNAMQSVRRMFVELLTRSIKNPVIITIDSNWKTADEHLIHYATEAGALLLDGMGDGVCFGMTGESYQLSAMSYQPTANDQQSTANASGRNYIQNNSPENFINNTAFGILQATRTRISKTEYISCPSCGRTLFDLQETTAKIRAVTAHLKGVKIAIMGCIVNGPGEMADADFGYVGSGVGKITLYKGKEVVKRNVPSEVAVDELVNLLKESEAWVEKTV